MTTNRSCFTRIIGHNSLTVHPIYTKFDNRIRPWTPFLCAKFQGDRSTRLRFIAIFASVRKHARGRRRNFGCSYLGNGLCDFLQIWNVDSPSWRRGWRATLTLQQIRIRYHRGTNYKGMKMTFSFFLSIYPRCGAPASWAARHTIVCLNVTRRPLYRVSIWIS